MGDTYTHGHQPSVLRSHRWRTAENSAPHLLPELRPGQRVLDLGCGPGTITVDLAERVAPGEVLGIDAAAPVLDLARRAAAERGATNVSFALGDACALAFEDGAWDVVHAHQVLQHLSDPVAALVEARRVLAPGGILAVRDADYASFAWWPAVPGLDRWLEVYEAVTARNGAEADAGRRLLGWARAAGFDDVDAGSSTWTFATPAARTWWGGLWADRCLESSFAQQAVEHGIATIGELGEIADAWRRWAEHEDAVFIVPHGEVIARR